MLQLADLPPALHHYASQVASDVEIDPQIGGAEPAAAATTKALSADTRSETPPPTAVSPATPPGSLECLKNYLRHQEVSHINRALATAGGDKEKAAALLGISLATLYRKLVEGEGNQ